MEYFLRTEGFRQVSFEEASVYYKSLQSHQHTIAKLNPCLTDLDEFEADEVALEKIRGKRPQLIKAERNYVMKFPMILERLCNEEKHKLWGKEERKNQKDKEKC